MWLIASPASEFTKETGRKESGDGVWRLADSARPPLRSLARPSPSSDSQHATSFFTRKGKGREREEGWSYIDRGLNVLLHPRVENKIGHNPLIRIFPPPDAEEMRLSSDLGFRA